MNTSIGDVIAKHECNLLTLSSPSADWEAYSAAAGVKSFYAFHEHVT